jgi:hypothetical protein
MNNKRKKKKRNAPPVFADFIFFLEVLGVETQDLVLARQLLYHLRYAA